MKPTHYYKRDTRKIKLTLRILGLALFAVGFIGSIYVFFPLLSWQLYIEPALAQHQITAPIPQTAILSSASLPSLLASSLQNLQQHDLSDASEWYPNYVPSTTHSASDAHTYLLSIPTLGITDASVSNADNDLNKHLVNYAGTSVPPEKGNAVVFGHSTLPAWFDPHNYKTIFATALDVKIGDKVIATVNGAQYDYIVDNISIVEADDTSPLEQQYDTSYLTIITCTPPGTIWKRLVIHSHLAKLTNT